MFYESIGALLSRAAEDLDSTGPGRPNDERAARELRQIVRLLRRVGAIWPALFRALELESKILEETLRDAAETVRAHGGDAPERPTTADAGDPLAHYRGLLCALDEIVILLHEHHRDPWARDALRALRRGLAHAADVQGRLVDAMLAA